MNNRSSLKKRVGSGIIVVAGNSLMQRTGDTNYPFRQDSDFLYLTGICEPKACLVIDIDADIEFILLDKKTGTAEIFDGNFDAQEIKSISGIAEIKSFKDGLAYIAAHAKKQKVYFNDVQNLNKVEFTLNDFRLIAKKRLKARRLDIVDVHPHIATLRMIKQSQEVTAIEQAVKVTKRSLQEVEAHIATSENEQDLLRVLNAQFINQSAKHAFAPLVQAGVNATVLHYDKSNQPLVQNSVVLLDVGAEIDNYAADISRTYVVGQNSQADEIIKAVQSTQAELINLIKPGATWRELSIRALELTAEQLIKLKIITNKNEAQKYFPHAFGHFMGLDVHDVGDYTQPLAENMVITVEPGIYVPEKGIGVRFEDDILVTKTGAKVL